MNFCNKCGSKLENGRCPKCSISASLKKSKSKNSKFILLTIAILVLLLGGTFIYMKSTIKSESELASLFSSYVSNKDGDKLEEILYCSDERLPINKANSDILIDYFNNNPSTFSEINDNFKNGKFISDSFPLEIKEVDKKLFFFPIYKVSIKPTFIKIKTDFKDTKVKINDETYANLKDKSEIGPLMPGDYTITAELSNSYLNKDKVIKVNTFDSNNTTIDVFDDLKRINITSDIPDADLYVNNKNTGIKVKDAKNFGPVEANSNIYAVTNENGKKIISNKYHVQDTSDIFIDFKSAKIDEANFKMDLFDLVKNYSSNFAYAVNYNDYNYIAPYIEYGSPMYSKQSKVITEIYNSDITESFENIDILNYKYDKDKNIGEVTCNEVYSIAKGNNVPKRQQFKSVYTFKKNTDGTLILTNIED